MPVKSSSIQRLRNSLSTPVGHRLISQRKNDVFIAAYPRSGSTWLRTILANIIDPGAAGNPDVFNQLIPAVSIRNACLINSLSDPRLIMTHSVWRPSINKAVYLVRDGRDALISSYHYYSTRAGLDISLDQFYDLYIKRTYGATWSTHTQSWLRKGASALGDNLHEIRFEELRQDPLAIVSRLCAFLGLSATDSEISTAIKHASLDHARQIERRRQGELSSRDASFYRQGKTEQWRQERYTTVISRFQQDSAEALKLSNYLDG